MTGVMGWSVEPEAMVAEPGVMGVNHRGYGVGARGYDRSYGVEPGSGYDRSYGLEPEAML